MTDVGKTRTQDRLLLVADLAGTLVFAVGGAMLAASARLDLLGVLVLSFTAALGGGILRDLLIGAVPPHAISDWRYAVTAFVGGIGVFLFHRQAALIPAWLFISLDAAGLALFTVAGAGKALGRNINPFLAVLLGGVTAVGGGVLRDVLVAHVPNVLSTDIYATAALLGAAVMVAGIRAGIPRTVATVAGAIACFGLRLLAVQQHWNLPRVGD